MTEQTKKKSKVVGGFQKMGLKKELLKGILKTGYNVPTPIQKNAIPLLLQGRDIVAMARTGSGKTAAFLIPLLNRLDCHSPSVGARAVILSPTRELAIQTLKFFKQLGKFMTLTASLFAGGLSIDEQFAEMTTNPDVLIATPGRLLHILNEANIKLKCVEYVVLDEADRLFELGLQEQIVDILKLCPEKKQMALFSATIPSAVAEFTNLTLHQPALVRLDSDIKISDTLKLGFFIVRAEQKWAALFYLLKMVVKPDSDHLTIIFVQTKHHAEYLNMLLQEQAIPSSIVHGAMDQEARTLNITRFRKRKTFVLVVTDVAARGLDIPFVTHVINFSFPISSKLFVHRVGRAGRRGESGTAYSLVSLDEIPYMIDLHLFLGRPLLNSRKQINEEKEDGEKDNSWSEDGYYGTIPEHLLNEDVEFINNLLSSKCEIESQYKTTVNAQKLYMKTRALSSPESVRRCKELLTNSRMACHPILSISDQEIKRIQFANEVKNYKANTTIFDYLGENLTTPKPLTRQINVKKPEVNKPKRKREDLEGDEEDDDINTDDKDSKRHKPSFNPIIMPATQDNDYFIPYSKAPSYDQAGYALNVQSLDMTPDDDNLKKQRVYKWDKKKKNYVQMSKEDAQKGNRKNESGKTIKKTTKEVKLYEKWTKKTNLHIQAPGEMEDKNLAMAGRSNIKRFQVKEGNIPMNRKEKAVAKKERELRTMEEIKSKRQKLDKERKRLQKVKDLKKKKGFKKKKFSSGKKEGKKYATLVK